MPGNTAEVLGKHGKYLCRVLLINDCYGDGVGKELSDPADDHTVADGDPQGTDNRDQPDDCSDTGVFLRGFHVESFFKCTEGT